MESGSLLLLVGSGGTSMRRTHVSQSVVALKPFRRARIFFASVM